MPSPALLADIHAAAFVFPRPWSQAEFDSLVADPFCVLVHKPEGFALGRVIAGEGELLTIAVRPGAQGKGIGTQLLSELIARFRVRGATRIVLEVATTNGSAVRLYERAGFAPLAIRRGYFATETGRIDASVMALDL
jgi:ribosomal-protein-alanine N-acetyltransferase